jgi:hypothetical protein
MKLAIVIPIDTDIDPSTLLDIAQQYSEIIRDEVESYGGAATVDEDGVMVTPAAGAERLVVFGQQ